MAETDIGNEGIYDDKHLLKQVEVRLRLQEGPAYYSKEPLDNPESAVNVMREVLRGLDREWVCVVNLDNKSCPVNFSVVSVGSINASMAPIQNIIKTAILSNCNQIILLHNHPSGSLEPSDVDYELTHRVLECCRLMEIDLVDHVIVGGMSGDVYSFRKHNSHMFDSGNIDLKFIHKMYEKEDQRLPKASEDSVTVVYPRQRHR